MSSWIQRAVSRFDAAAHGETDDAATRVQRLIAEDLAVRVSGLGLPPHPRVLEVGCGSGYLTAALVERLSEPHVTATDNSPAMVRATAGLALPGVSTHVMDGENPDAPAERFDLVCTSLAAQGFSDLQGSMQKLMRCVKPGGYMAVATLGCHTFHEWREAARKAGVEPHDRGYPSAEALADMMGEGTGVEELTPVVSSMSGHGFLRDLKAVGAHTRVPGQKSLTAGQLRRILRELEGVDGQVYTTYHVLFGIRRKPHHRPG